MEARRGIDAAAVMRAADDMPTLAAPPALADSNGRDLELTPDAEAELAVAAIHGAAKALGEAIAQERALEDGRAAQKTAAIQRLLKVENPETGKVHSASSAEKVVEMDNDYMAYRDYQSQAVVARIEAQGRYDAALRAADLAIERVRAANAASEATVRSATRGIGA